MKNASEDLDVPNCVSPASEKRDSSLEDEFTRIGITKSEGDADPAPGFWTFRKVHYNQIDIEKSIRNQARCEAPLIQSHLALLQINLDKGCKFPAGTGCIDPATGKIVLVDGNHRISLSDKYKFVNLYIVAFASEKARRRFTKTANNRNGLPNSEASQLQHAINEIENYDATIEDACKLFGVKKERLKEQLLIMKFNNAFGKKSKANSLNETVKREIGTAIERVTLSVAELLVDEAIKNPKINANQIKLFCEAYRKCATTDEQKAMTKDLAGRFATMEKVKKQETDGGVMQGRAKKVMTKPDLLRQADKLLAVLRLPSNGTQTSITSDEIVRLEALETSLRDFIKLCSKKDLVIA
jgi:hypothetical protein